MAIVTPKIILSSPMQRGERLMELMVPTPKEEKKQEEVSFVLFLQ